jgi:hypothetical protein
VTLLITLEMLQNVPKEMRWFAFWRILLLDLNFSCHKSLFPNHLFSCSKRLCLTGISAAVDFGVSPGRYLTIGIHHALNKRVNTALILVEKRLEYGFSALVRVTWFQYHLIGSPKWSH